MGINIDQHQNDLVTSRLVPHIYVKALNVISAFKIYISCHSLVSPLFSHPSKAYINYWGGGGAIVSRRPLPLASTTKRYLQNYPPIIYMWWKSCLDKLEQQCGCLVAWGNDFSWRNMWTWVAGCWRSFVYALHKVKPGYNTIKVSVITVGILHRSSFEEFARNVWRNWFSVLH